MLGYRTHKDRRAADDALMARARETYNDLEKYLYTGMAGLVQRSGHRRIHRIVETMGFKEAGQKVLEIGAGFGHHLSFGSPYADYTAIDIRVDAIAHLTSAYPEITALTANAQDLPFGDASFDAVLSIYNLEHIEDLESVLSEVARVLKTSGCFIVAVPAEGGFIYNVGRELTSKRFYEKTYALDYDAIIRREHCNEIWDVERGLREKYSVDKALGIPFRTSWYHLSLINIYICTKN